MYFSRKEVIDVDDKFHRIRFAYEDRYYDQLLWPEVKTAMDIYRSAVSSRAIDAIVANFRGFHPKRGEIADINLDIIPAESVKPLVSMLVNKRGSVPEDDTLPFGASVKHVVASALATPNLEGFLVSVGKTNFSSVLTLMKFVQPPILCAEIERCVTGLVKLRPELIIAQMESGVEVRKRNGEKIRMRCTLRISSDLAGQLEVGVSDANNQPLTCVQKIHDQSWSISRDESVSNLFFVEGKNTVCKGSRCGSNFKRPLIVRVHGKVDGVRCHPIDLNLVVNGSVKQRGVPRFEKSKKQVVFTKFGSDVRVCPLTPTMTGRDIRNLVVRRYDAQNAFLSYFGTPIRDRDLLINRGVTDGSTIEVIGIVPGGGPSARNEKFVLYELSRGRFRSFYYYEQDGDPLILFGMVGGSLSQQDLRDANEMGTIWSLTVDDVEFTVRNWKSLDLYRDSVSVAKSPNEIQILVDGDTWDHHDGFPGLHLIMNVHPDSTVLQTKRQLADRICICVDRINLIAGSVEPLDWQRNRDAFFDGQYVGMLVERRGESSDDEGSPDGGTLDYRRPYIYFEREFDDDEMF